jgi:hypothetical protein
VLLLQAGDLEKFDGKAAKAVVKAK